ncbi:MAG: flagellar export chaperone FliS [Defluviitaleaceae bacterium]|nr:flagellar export chaperone FliS [Defluviitaleaceae bacterium]
MNNPYNTYKNNAVFTATKEELTTMLYDGAVRFCNQAILAMENGDMQKTNDMIQRTQAIVQEFRLTLDKKYDISIQLDSIYEYMHHNLMMANAKKDLTLLTAVRDDIKEMRDTWKEATKKSRITNAPATKVLNNQSI